MDHDNGYKALFSHPEMVAQSELMSTFASWVSQLLSRIPGSQFSVLSKLEEVKSMLAERAMEWPQEWKEEGRKEGLKEGLNKVRVVLIRELESRFGPLSLEARRCVESLDSYERIMELSIAAATAPSLAALGLC